MKKLALLKFVIAAMFVSCTYAADNYQEDVEKAYLLRMNGELDKAEAILDSIIQIDSTVAIAHYEWARLKSYKLLGGGKPEISGILSSAEKATEYDPDNAIYAYFLANTKYLNAYMAMQMGQEDANALIEETMNQYEKVLLIKPDYYEASLYLVELYGLLPEDMGGDLAKANSLAEKLSSQDTYYGAMAKAVLAPDTLDYVQYWEDIIASEGRLPAYLAEAGKACLYKDDPDQAETYFKEAIQLNKDQNIRYLDLARYSMYQVMYNKDMVDTELPKAIKFVKVYLQSKPAPLIPLQAYAIGMQARFEKFLGNKEVSDQLKEKAKGLDPYFSRASGIPSPILFSLPDQICHHHTSFFMPF